MPNLDVIWTPDLLPGFGQATLTGLTAPDGPIELVLVCRRCPEAAAGNAVL